MCVITYRRPKELKRLMGSLDRLGFDKSGEAPAIEVIVVDNDPSGPACTFCEEVRSDLNWPLRCFVEPRRGIPFARNTAVARALERAADFIAFIDDDEVPEPSWLQELLYAQGSYDADVVAGPVVARFSVPPAPWIEDWIRRRIYSEHNRPPTGTPIDVAATNNVLVRSQVFNNMEKLFDARFAFSGGSDSAFFRRVHHRGYKMVWADDALVYEWVPESRTTVRWLLSRFYRFGNIYSVRSVGAEPTITVRVRLVAEASKLIAGGLPRTARSLVRLLRSRHNLWSLIVDPRSVANGQEGRSLIRSLRPICRGAGILSGITGRRYRNYRKIHTE